MVKRRPQPNDTSEVPLLFPVHGVDDQFGYWNQRLGTAVDAVNVRGFDPKTDRARGSSRTGCTKYMDDFAVALNSPIQHMASVVTTDVDDIALSKVGYSGYALASGDGFGVANASGTSQWTLDTNTSELGCQCWDDDDYVYTATIIPGTGAVSVYKHTAAGVLQANFPVSTTAVANIRGICGMVVIGDFLYIAGRSGATASFIRKIHKTTGVLKAWRTDSNTSGLLFSTTGCQVMAKIGTKLGVACMGASGGTAQCFKIIDTTKAVGASGAVISKTLTGSGVAIARRTTVRSDGIAFFYAITDCTTSIVKKISLGGNIEWASTVFDTDLPQGLAYDFSLGVLIGVTTANATIRQLSLTLGTTVTSASTTAYHWADSDNHGFFYLYVNGSGGGNDTVQVNSTYSVTWDETRANTTHTGAAANKGKEQAPSRHGNNQTRNIAISGGTFVRITPDGPVSINSGGASFDGTDDAFISSAQHGNDLYIVDGSTFLKYTSTSDAITKPSATAGSLPVDDQSMYARILVKWLDRLGHAALPGDTNTLFLSRAGDPLDYDYDAVEDGTEAWAIAFDDAIHAVIPHKDDVLMVLCDHSIFQLTGDPAAGGRQDLVDGSIGAAWGPSWCVGPGSIIYFFGTMGGIYRLIPGGGPPLRMSDAIRRRLDDAIDLDNVRVSMAWDHRNDGLAVWTTPYDSTQNGQNFFWEARTNAWWPDLYSDKKLCPLAVHVVDGPSADDRFILIGGRDGYIRRLNDQVEDDDGRPIESFVFMGPIKTALGDDVMLKNMQTQMDDDSGNVNWSVHFGQTPALALSCPFPKAGLWTGGRNPTSWVNRSGFIQYVKMASILKSNGLTDRWVHEKTVCEYATQGPIRRREG